MERMLGAAGLPQEVLSMIPQIIETCRECRAWQPPGPATTPSAELVIAQNDQVEGDILFYKRNLAWHMVDRADRWEAAVQVSDKTTESLCEAIDVCWLQIWGPFKLLVVDGEAGLAAGDALQYLKRKGIEVKPRAPRQHAQIVERRGAMLRHAMHLIEEQLAKEGIPITFKQLLA
jgi:hypothetical protein